MDGTMRIRPAPLPAICPARLPARRPSVTTDSFDDIVANPDPGAGGRQDRGCSRTSASSSNLPRSPSFFGEEKTIFG